MSFKVYALTVLTKLLTMSGYWISGKSLESSTGLYCLLTNFSRYRALVTKSKLSWYVTIGVSFVSLSLIIINPGKNRYVNDTVKLVNKVTLRIA